MKNDQSFPNIESPWMGRLGQEDFSLLCAMYHLTYDGEWHSVFVSDGCLMLLNCEPENFLETLQSCTVYLEPEGTRMQVRTLLQKLAEKPNKLIFTGSIQYPEGKTRRMKSVIYSRQEKHGEMKLYGQMIDITREYILADQVRQHMEERLEETERTFNLVAQHSDRILYAYDLETGRTSPWNLENEQKDILAHLYEGSYSDAGLDENRFILPDCAEDVKRFFADIHSGKPEGEVRVHVALLDGQRKWYHFKYSNIFKGDTPVTALISIEDVTRRHEQELSHLRLIQATAEKMKDQLSYLEVDLTADVVEKHIGLELWNAESFVGKSYSGFVHTHSFGLAEQDHNEAIAIYSRNALLLKYEQKIYNIEKIWKAAGTENPFWMLSRVEMMADPFSGHIKAFISISDITADHEERLAVIKRADYDDMTGLLRRGIGEEQIRRHLTAAPENGGILMVLDLDDLKKINDTLGHNHGDKAITGIANTLKGHFRKDDILVRAGGDEFIVFLPGAGKSVSSMELSIAALLRKLAGISIGDADEQTIHCSAGCAVELPETDTFESLYQRADIALYHVKRNGKNNFAFFEPEMLQADYQFKMRHVLPQTDTAATAEELRYLLETVSGYFPWIISLNLTRNFFRILHTEREKDQQLLSGTLDQFWQHFLEDIHPEDRQDAFAALSRIQLLSDYEKGRRSLRYIFRYRLKEQYSTASVLVTLHTTATGDICAFVFCQQDVDREIVREVQRLHKILEMTERPDFEYICLIDVQKGIYSTFSRDGRNSHDIPEIADFNTVTRHIRDTHIRPEEREAYYQAAALEQVLEYMEALGGKYSYRYELEDGTREASFAWYEKSHTELLMTVRRVPNL